MIHDGVNIFKKIESVPKDLGCKKKSLPTDKCKRRRKLSFLGVNFFCPPEVNFSFSPPIHLYIVYIYIYIYSIQYTDSYVSYLEVEEKNLNPFYL